MANGDMVPTTKTSKAPEEEAASKQAKLEKVNGAVDLRKKIKAQPKEEENSGVDEKRFKALQKTLDSSKPLDYFSDEELTKLESQLNEDKDLLAQALNTEKYFDFVVQSLLRINSGGRMIESQSLQKFALSFINDHLKQIDEGIVKGYSKESKTMGVAAVRDLGEYGEHFGITNPNVLDILLKNLDQDTISSYGNYDSAAHLGYILEKMDDSQYSMVRDKLASLFSDSDINIRNKMTWAISHLSGEYAERFKKDIFEKFLEEFGLDYEDLKKAWDAGLSGEEGEFHVIAKLEKQRPGICKALIKEFGVKNFSRYPVEMLIKQYDEKDNPDIPYGIVLYPYSDWSGAFRQNQDTFDSLSKQLKQLGYTARVFEIATKWDAGRALVSCDRKYGQKNKISFAIIGGHGKWSSIYFGEESTSKDSEEWLRQHDRMNFNLGDLLGKGVQRTYKFFEENPTIMLSSCSTGERDGIGQELSKVGAGGTQVIAPDKPTGLDSIDVDKGADGRLHFEVKYRDDVRAAYIGGRPK